MRSGFLAIANRALDCYAMVFARPIFRNWNAWLVQLGFRGLGVLNHRTDALSGERHLLQSRLRQFLGTDTPVMFDVGANEGDYAEQLRNLFPNGQLFVFEPHPATFARLTQRLGATANLTCAAVGASTGRTILFDHANGNGSGHASVHGRVFQSVHHVADPARIDVGVITIDDFCERNRIDRIDLLKIDTEGNELEVLKGASRLLRRGGIRYVQFEFNEMNVASRVFLSDFSAILPDHRLFRLLPGNLLPVEKVPLTQEVFAFQNLLAVPHDEIERCGLPDVSWYSRQIA